MKLRLNSILRIIGIIILVFCLNFGNSALAQQNKEPIQNRFIFGGGLGLQFGTITLIDISPMVGYKITERFIAGLGFTYQYYKNSSGIPVYPVYETNIYGGSVFARYYVFRDFFAHAEYQLLNYEPYYVNPVDKKRVTVPAYLIGGGYRQWLGPNVSVNILILFNLNETIDSPYRNPIFRVGIGVGI
ncbi:MAG: hypothetical protein KAV44_06390 [Bacteroidales bacterium]|nr:hypothetical protein [Bacteroidales bacterium]